jgi:deferrochelatase/peroxidase EfeB
MRLEFEPQPVLTRLTAAAIFLVVTVDEGGEDTVRDLFADVGGLSRSVGFRVPEGGLACVVGIGAGLYERLFAGPRPAGLANRRSRPHSGRRAREPREADCRVGISPLRAGPGQPPGDHGGRRQ